MAALVLLLSPSSATAQTAGCLGGCANNNTVLGTSAGYSATGSGSIYLGYASGYNDTGSNDFFVNNVQQSSLANDKAYSLIYGNFSGTAGSLTGQQLVINGNVGIGTASPQTTLQVNGSIMMGTGTCSASTAGSIQYSGGAVQSCNGTSWATLGTGGGLTWPLAGAADTVSAPDYAWSGHTTTGLYYNTGIGFTVGGSNVGTITTTGLNGAAIGATAASTGGFTTLAASGAITDTRAPAANTSIDGIILTDTTAASSGNQQYSPRVHFTGQGWKTTATAASQAVDMIEELQPVQGTANPTGNLTWSSSVNGGAYGALMTLTSTGNVGIGTTSPQAPLHVAGGVIIGTDTATCTSAKTGEVHYNATTTYMEYCNGSAWNPFEQPQCSTGSTAACWLPVTRSSGDSNFTAANIVSGTTILGITGTYTPCAVTVPNPEFTNQTGAALSTLTPSNIISIITNSCGAVASISGAAGAQYRICSNASCSTVVQAYSSSSGTVSNGQYVQMEMTSSSSQNTQTTATLTLSATNMPWSITTLTYQGPGDVVSGATAWWGLRAYNAAYAASGGNAITIRRASDNTTQTIAVLSSGDLNVSAASTFCASTTCYVTEAYDQTGNGNNQTQATAAKQPQLVFNCTGSLPCMKFTSSSSQYLSSTLTINQPLTISTVALNSSGATGQIMAGSNGNCSLEWNAAYITIYGGSSPTVNSAAISTSTFYAIQGIINGSSSVNYVDGTAVTGTLSTSGLATIVGLGAYGSGTNPMSGDITEAGVWGSAFNSTQQSSMNSNQRGYWGI